MTTPLLRFVSACIEHDTEGCRETVTAYAATSATEPLTKTTITRREVGPHDVAFDIHFAGICDSDIHTVRGEWGQVTYPVVPGHEIAGIVTEVGVRPNELQGWRSRRCRLFRRFVPGM